MSATCFPSWPLTFSEPGSGGELRVERYADSLGLDSKGLDPELLRFGEMSCYTLSWLPEPASETATPSLTP